MEPLVRSLPIDKIHPSNTALLVIDMQRDFIDMGTALETPGGRELVPTINRLIAWARHYGASVIFTHEMHRNDKSDYGIELEFEPVHCLEGTPGCELTDGLDVQSHDYRIRNKRRYDCFLGTDLDLLLRSNRIENLICCGVIAHICVMSTVYTARNLDYRVLVPRDAIADATLDRHAAALLCMSDVFAYITTVDQVCSIADDFTIDVNGQGKR